MTRGIVSFSLLFALAALGVGCAPHLGSRSCTPGRAVPCACDDGAEGQQVCGADGESFGACVCSGDAGVRLDGGSSGIDAAMTPVDAGRDAGPPGIDAGPPPVDAWTAPDAGPPPPRCTWAWHDRGGPAFQPHACRPGAGVVGGMLVDPQAFFTELVAGRDADSWETVMNDVETTLWSCGVGQQRGSGGDVRGRLFLPTGACPDSSPPAGDMDAMRLGVRQDPACWDHPADVVDCL